MTSGPYLYDDGPQPLHTGTPRRRQGLLIGTLVGTVLVAVGMVVALFVVRGTPEEQSREAVGVFLSALEAGDTETAHELLCEEERARVQPTDVADEYAGEGDGRVVDAVRGEVDGGAVQLVEVRWADGTERRLVVVSENGPRVCGLAD